MISHTHDVRVLGKPVNMENVHLLCEEMYVSEELTIGARLREMWQDTGLSMLAFAKRCGYTTASGVQRYLDDHYAPRRLPLEIAEKLAKGFEGYQDPSVIAGMTGVSSMPSIEPNAIPIEMEGASRERMVADLPVFGTALGASRIISGEAVEQTTLNQGDIVSYAKRPTILNGRIDAYGLYVVGSSMYPVHPEGSTILVEKKRPPRVGDDVVVYLRANGDDDDGERARAVLVKRLVRRTAQYIELEQFTPAIIFRIDNREVLRVDRVMTLGDLLS
jgi:SOS-response transcriptional repressor LexA